MKHLLFLISRNNSVKSGWSTSSIAALNVTWVRIIEKIELGIKIDPTIIPNHPINIPAVGK